MRVTTVATLLFAGCCLFAVVSMAATLESGVQGTPDDVVDVDMEDIPLPSKQAEELKNSLQSGDNPAADERQITSSRSGSESEQAAVSDSSESGDRQHQQSSGEGPQDQRAGGAGDGSGSSSSDSQSGHRGGGDGTGQVPGADGLISFLKWLLRQLLGVLGAVVALGVFGLLVYKRRLLLDRLRALLGRAESAGSPHSSDASREPRSPENRVERLWLKMLSVGGVSEQSPATPRERAEAAIDAGLRPEPVRELTALFEDVRYGDRPVTTSEVQAASDYLQRSVPADDD